MCAAASVVARRTSAHAVPSRDKQGLGDTCPTNNRKALLRCINAQSARLRESAIAVREMNREGRLLAGSVDAGPQTGSGNVVGKVSASDAPIGRGQSFHVSTTSIDLWAAYMRALMGQVWAVAASQPQSDHVDRAGMFRGCHRDGVRPALSAVSP